MHGIGARQTAILLIAAGMMTVGSLGLSGQVSASPALGAVLLLAAIFLAIDAGHRVTQLR